MLNQKTEQKKEQPATKTRLPYQPPAVIYAGHITTRAGTPTSINGSPDESAVDPTDLFGDG